VRTEIALLATLGLSACSLEDVQSHTRTPALGRLGRTACLSLPMETQDRIIRDETGLGGVTAFTEHMWTLPRPQAATVRARVYERCLRETGTVEGVAQAEEIKSIGKID
jgi:hypothetical protein